MTSGNDRKGRTELPAISKLTASTGLVALAGGVIMWMWFGDWRSAVSGLVVFVTALALAAMLAGASKRD